MSSTIERNVNYAHESDYEMRSVRTRISWSAIAAGVAVSLAIYTLLMSLGIAVGLSVTDDVTSRSFGTGAGIWSVLALLIALFAGGWVTTQVTIGESRTEAVLYGVVLWATTSVLLLWLAANGIQAGMNTADAMESMASGNPIPRQTTNPQGLSQSNEGVQGTTVTQDDNGMQGNNTTQGGDEMRRAREAGREGSWWAFAGILLSMGASIGGALAGPVELTLRMDSRYSREPRHTQST